ncbi:MAG: hypothetical protein ACFCD0_03985 [Gemmataceae bacterium]
MTAPVWFANIQNFFTTLPWWAFGLFVLGVIVFMILVTLFVLGSLTRDYFVNEITPVSDRSLLGILSFLLRNLFAVVLIVGGLILVLPIFPLPPGSGFIFSLVGIIISDIPGKRKLLYRIISIPKVHRATTWLRHRIGKESFFLKEDYNMIREGETSPTTAPSPNSESIQPEPAAVRPNRSQSL